MTDRVLTIPLVKSLNLSQEERKRLLRPLPSGLTAEEAKAFIDERVSELKAAKSRV